MRKWLIGTLLTLLLLVVAAIYFLIPDNIRVSRAVISGNNHSGVFRFLSYPDNWQKWWPGSVKDSIWEFNGYEFKMSSIRFNGLTILINKNDRTDTSVVHVLPVGPDSVKIIWDVGFKTSNNPLERLNRYLAARKLASRIDSVLIAMKKHTSTVSNIYGWDIKRVKIQTEYMFLDKRAFDRRPTDKDIYGIIEEIRAQIARAKATEEDYPIFNITPVDSSRYELVVGVFVTEPNPNTGKFQLKKLLKNGNLLTAEVTGGHATLDSAMKQFDFYADDHHYQIVAIPFQSFRTDRLKNPDSTKWVTKIGYPVL